MILSRSFSSKVEPTEHVQQCATMFGIGIDEDIKITLYQDLEIKLGKGRIIYLTGDSGAGKSCLLKDIRANLDKGFQPIETPEVADLSEAPLVDQFDGLGLKDVGELLAYVGIAEAFVYLRKPQELSDGQRYRFLLAKMLHEAGGMPDGVVPVIFIDEYLAFLDRETAKCVAFQTRRVARKSGICFVVATTHSDIAEDLAADQQITLRLNLPPEVKKRTLGGI